MGTNREDFMKMLKNDSNQRFCDVTEALLNKKRVIGSM